MSGKNYGEKTQKLRDAKVKSARKRAGALGLLAASNVALSRDTC